MQIDINSISFEANSPVPRSHAAPIGRDIDEFQVLSNPQNFYQRPGRIGRKRKYQENKSIKISNQPNAFSIPGSYRRSFPIRFSNHDIDILVNFPVNQDLNTPLMVKAFFPESGDAWDTLERLIGTVDGPSDWASQHDHYLYGTSKR